MNKLKITIAFFLVLTCFLVACSSDSSSSASSDNENAEDEFSVFDTLVVDNPQKLPECNSDREGEAYFVKGENLPYFCIKATWRSAADSTDFSISCKDGFLIAKEKIVQNPPLVDSNNTILNPSDSNSISTYPMPHNSWELEPNYGTPQEITITGNAFAISGPFMFGTSISVYPAYGNPVQIAEGCIISNDGSYILENIPLDTGCVKITAKGFYKNAVSGKVSNEQVSFSALSCKEATTNINTLTHLEIPRIDQLRMNHVEFNAARAQAEREFFIAFGIDTTKLYAQQFFTDGRTDKPIASDLSIIGYTEYSAALLAISAMLQGDRNENEMMNLVTNLAEDIKGDGQWHDPNWKIKIADWLVGVDSSYRYNDIRNNISAWGLGSVPNFENYMKNFIPMVYNFETCSESNAGQVTYVNQGQSIFFANDYEHADHSKVRFICDKDSKQWRVATEIEKDTLGFGPGQYDREIREGRVNHDKPYIYDKDKWRMATPEEADGFTSLVRVYQELKADEKVVFIIRHSKRTNDTGPTGHLTDDGKKFAFELGQSLAAIKYEDIYYGYSGYTRTKETCENIAKGMGQENYTLEILPGLDGDWYVEDSEKADKYSDSYGGWEVFSKYAFEGDFDDAFYDLESRSEQLLENEILANLSNMNRVNILCTHDYLVVPLLAYITDGHANLRYYEKHKWVNYLAGVAMIISPDGSVRYEPVKGLETGLM